MTPSHLADLVTEREHLRNERMVIECGNDRAYTHKPTMARLSRIGQRIREINREIEATLNDEVA